MDPNAAIALILELWAAWKQALDTGAAEARAAGLKKLSAEKLNAAQEARIEAGYVARGLMSWCKKGGMRPVDTAENRAGLLWAKGNACTDFDALNRVFVLKKAEG